ncbi:hypothetical protein ACROYT_G029331 [Oculina patagonica]
MDAGDLETNFDARAPHNACIFLLHIAVREEQGSCIFLVRSFIKSLQSTGIFKNSSYFSVLFFCGHK